MDNFKAIYQILRYLEKAMDYAEPDYMPIKAETLGLTEDRWKAIIRMLAHDGYIEGVTVKNYMNSINVILRFDPAITLKGLEYLHENIMMRKLADRTSGVVAVGILGG